MKRDILFLKNVGLANELLKSGKCENCGKWIIRCNDDVDTMKELQNICSEYLKDTPYKNYKLTFANSENYKDVITL